MSKNSEDNHETRIARQPSELGSVDSAEIPKPPLKQRLKQRVRDAGAEALGVASDFFADTARPRLGARFGRWSHRVRAKPPADTDDRDVSDTDSAEHLESLIWPDPLADWSYVQPRAHLDALRQLSSVVCQLPSQNRDFPIVVLEIVRAQLQTANLAYQTARQRLGENPEFGEMYQQGRAALNNMQLAIAEFQGQQESDERPKLAYDLLVRCHQLGARVEDSLARLERSVRVG